MDITHLSEKSVTWTVSMIGSFKSVKNRRNKKYNKTKKSEVNITQSPILPQPPSRLSTPNSSCNSSITTQQLNNKNIIDIPKSIQVNSSTKNDKSITNQGYSDLKLMAITKLEATTNKGKDIIDR